MNDFYDEEAEMPYYPDEQADDAAGDSAIERIKQVHERELLTIDGVEGVGIGQNEIGDKVILVYLRDAETVNKIPQNIEGFEVRTQITGVIDAYLK